MPTEREDKPARGIVGGPQQEVLTGGDGHINKARDWWTCPVTGPPRGAQTFLSSGSRAGLHGPGSHWLLPAVAVCPHPHPYPSAFQNPCTGPASPEGSEHAPLACWEVHAGGAPYLLGQLPRPPAGDRCGVFNLPQPQFLSPSTSSEGWAAPWEHVAAQGGLPALALCSLRVGAMPSPGPCGAASWGLDTPICPLPQD